jgi:hypothetical protein
MTSNHEFGEETTAREVADAFGKEIAGKTGEGVTYDFDVKSALLIH